MMNGTSTTKAVIEKMRIFKESHLRTLRSNIMVTLGAWLLVMTALAGGTGNLDLFSGVKGSTANDTLKLYAKEKAEEPSSPVITSTIPDRFKLYDLDLDGRISEWEMKDAVKDFREKDTPYSRQEMAIFLDYFFEDR